MGEEISKDYSSIHSSSEKFGLNFIERKEFFGRYFTMDYLYRL
jgi:hypothetical protein